MNLIRSGIAGRVWADLGAGSGAFTLALADVLGTGGEIHAVDRDASALQSNSNLMKSRFPDVPITYYGADFTRELELPTLDGMVMANSLHFQREPGTVLATVRGHLGEHGRIVLVEYNIESGNFAVPHPVPFSRWERLAREAGFGHTEMLSRRPSRFLREIYSAVSW